MGENQFSLKKFIEDRGEGLKKLGAISWLLNRTEIFLVSEITSFFTLGSNLGSGDKFMIFNHSLWDEKIFPTLENKKNFLSKIIKMVGKFAEKKDVEFDEKVYLGINKKIELIQNIRNKLSHNFLSFSEDGKFASYINPKEKSRIEINLDETIEELEKEHYEIQRLLSIFQHEAQKVFGIILNPKK